MASALRLSARVLRNALFQSYRQTAVCSGMRGFASAAEADQDEFKFETLDGDLDGRFSPMKCYLLYSV